MQNNILYIIFSPYFYTRDLFFSRNEQEVCNEGCSTLKDLIITCIASSSSQHVDNPEQELLINNEISGDNSHFDEY